MVPQEISCLQHKVLLPCLSPSSGNTSTTTDNTTDTASSSATPGNYERSLHQPFRRGLLLSRNRSQAALCPPAQRARPRQELQGIVVVPWSMVRVGVGTCPPWSDPKPYLFCTYVQIETQMLPCCYYRVVQGRPSWGAQSGAAGCPCQVWQLVLAMQNMMHFEGAESLLWVDMHVLVTEPATASECS